MNMPGYIKLKSAIEKDGVMYGEPAEEYEFVIHAHWKNVKRVLNTEWGECSNCDRANDLTRYCPYCGAKMDKVSEVIQ